MVLVFPNIFSLNLETSDWTDLKSSPIFATDSVFSDELSELGSKLEWSQQNLGASDEVSYLKKYYSLLQIKDYLLAKKISLLE